MVPSSISGLVQQLRDRCAGAGFDLCTVTSTSRLQTVAPELPDFGRPDAVAVVVGNTRAMWPHFLAQAQAERDPLDRWAQRRITAITQDLSMSAEVFFPWDPPPRRLPFQRLAAAAGLAWLAPSWLLVHPEYGPWISLRALIVLDLDVLEEYTATGVSCAAPVEAVCGACEHACKPRFDAALAASSGATDTTAPTSQHWLAVRDACPVGQQHRFSNHQLAYHYDKDLVRLWHQPFWCEENVYQLSRYPEHAAAVAAFISNANKRVALWSQRAGRVQDGLVVWDYHVVLLGADGWVRDADCLAGSRLSFADWARATFPHGDGVPDEFRPLFRVVPVAALHAEFASDRSHMRTPDGGFAQPPPHWPPIGEGMTLPRFIDMDEEDDEEKESLCDLSGLSDIAAKMLASKIPDV